MPGRSTSGRSGAFVCGLKPMPGSVRSSIVPGAVSSIGGMSAIGASDAVAVTANAPVASTVVVPVVASDRTSAFVVTSKRFTTSAPPTAASPPARPPASARFWEPSFAVALTVAGPVDVIVTPRPTVASVRSWTF